MGQGTMSDPIQRMYQEAFGETQDELTRQDVLDLMDACAVASEDLRYRQDLPDSDYDPADKKQMLEKAVRLDDIFFRLCRFPQVELTRHTA